MLRRQKKIWATLYLSSGVDLERRQEITEKIKQRTATSGERQEAREHAGVGISLAPKGLCSGVRAVNSRMMWAVMQRQEPWALVSA